MAVTQDTEVQTVTVTINGQEVKAVPGRDGSGGGPQHRGGHPHALSRRAAGAVRGLPAVPGRGRGRARGPMPACATKVNDGMVVQTNTEKILKLRKFVLELLLSNHPLDCPVCEAAGDCRLQDYAYELRGQHVPLGLESAGIRASRDDHPNVARNPNRCILCGRCVRICRDVMGIGCWGFPTGVPHHHRHSLQHASARGGVRLVRAVHQHLPGGRPQHEAQPLRRPSLADGEDQDHLCLLRRGLRADCSTPSGASWCASRPRPAEGVNNGNLCSRGRFGMEYVNSPDRLTTPLVRDEERRAGAQPRGTWPWTAWSRTSRRSSRRAAARRSPFLASAKCTNEENYLLQKFARGVLGTNNIDHCCPLMTRSTVAGLATAFG